MICVYNESSVAIFGIAATVPSPGRTVRGMYGKRLHRSTNRSMCLASFRRADIVEVVNVVEAAVEVVEVVEVVAVAVVEAVEMVELA
jgi:hypothetical protein